MYTFKLYKMNKERNKMPETFPWIQLITSIVATIALLLSIWGLKFSYDANKLSEKALNQASKTAIEQLRPRIQLKPAVSKSGMSLQASHVKNDIIFLTNVTISNKGDTPANNIKLLNHTIDLIFPGNKKNKVQISPTSSVPTSLSPHQDFNLSTNVVFTPEKTENIDIIMELWKTNKIYVSITYEFNYTDVSLEFTYKISAKYDLYKTIGKIIKYNDQ